MADWLGAVQAVTIIGLEGLCAFALAWLFWPEIRRDPIMAQIVSTTTESGRTEWILV